MDSRNLSHTTLSPSVPLVFPITIFDGIRPLLSCSTLLASQGLGQTVPDASHENGTEEVLERYEGIVDPEEQRRKLEVDKEDADAKVNKGMRSRYEVGLLVQHEDDGSSNGSLGGEGGLHDLHSRGGPDTTHQPFHDLEEACPVALDCANEDHAKVAVGEDLGSVCHSIIDLLHPVNFLHGSQKNFDREELGNLVSNVKGRVEDDIPDGSGQEQLLVILEGPQDRLTQEEVGEEATSKDSKHCGKPVCQRVFAREGEGAGAQVVSHVEAAQGTVSYVKIRIHFQFRDLVGHL